jgi:hypothetical protein
VVEGEEGTGTQSATPLPHPQISSHSFWILGLIFFLLHKKPWENHWFLDLYIYFLHKKPQGNSAGGYGTVYRVKRKGDGQLFAIKCNLPPSVLPSLSPSCACFMRMKEAAAAAAAHIQTNRKCFLSSLTCSTVFHYSLSNKLLF